MALNKKGKSKVVLTTISPSSTAGLKFRPPTETPRENTKGKLPCAEATTIQQVILMMIVHLCRKVIYGFDVSFRVGFYILGTLLISVVSDYKSTDASRSYFADPGNFLNQWLVKLGWGWTVSVAGCFTYLTARTYSCGRFSVIRNNVLRLVVATVAWFSVTSFFEIVENKSGMCEVVRYSRKETCLANGFLWKGFDISGHCFLLVFSNLFIIEEGKAYLGWERIRDFLRNEEHRRVNDLKDVSDTPITKLKNEEFLWLRTNYPLSTGYVRLTFCLLACLSMLWDVMLLVTLFYFHMMIEKVVASSLAVLVWFLLYKFVYQQDFSPGLPGNGPFQYVTWREPSSQRRPARAQQRPQEDGKKWSSKDEIPMFMGMPLYGLRGDHSKDEAPADEAADNREPGGHKRSSIAGGGGRGSTADLARPLGRARSRSQSRVRLASSKSILNIKF